MVSIKTALVKEALMLQDYTCYHYTHRKIPVLMVLIIEACEVIRLLHDCLKREFSILFREFSLHLGTKMPITSQSFVARSFSKLHRVPHMILHLVIYISLRNSKMADRSLQRM